MVRSQSCWCRAFGRPLLRAPSALGEAAAAAAGGAAALAGGRVSLLAADGVSAAAADGGSAAPAEADESEAANSHAAAIAASAGVVLEMAQSPQRRTGSRQAYGAVAAAPKDKRIPRHTMKRALEYMRGKRAITGRAPPSFSVKRGRENSEEIHFERPSAEWLAAWSMLVRHMMKPIAPVASPAGLRVSETINCGQMQRRRSRSFPQWIDRQLAMYSSIPIPPPLPLRPPRPPPLSTRRRPPLPLTTAIVMVMVPPGHPLLMWPQPTPPPLPGAAPRPKDHPARPPAGALALVAATDSTPRGAISEKPWRLPLYNWRHEKHSPPVCARCVVVVGCGEGLGIKIQNQLPPARPAGEALAARGAGRAPR